MTKTNPAPDDHAKDDDGLIGRQLGEFRILRHLGKGGMADVYLAEQTTLKRKVAIKLLRTTGDLAPDATQLKRFEREARAAGNLVHQNIVQVYMIGEQDGVPYIAQEYVKGINLRDFLKKKGPASVPAAIHIMRQVAAALQAAAEAGVVHRDIKPENIMITKKGEAKVADFGLAQLSLGGDMNLTQEGVTMGTPLYMSPEQVKGKGVDHRSDIYSFGVTCYHLLTGTPPFRGETALSVAVQHLNEEPPSIRTRRADLPQPMIDIVEKMMAKDRKERYPDCQKLIADLKKLHRLIRENPDYTKLSASDFATSRETDTMPLTKLGRFKEWEGRRNFTAFIISAILVASSSAALGWYLRPPDPFRMPAADQAGRIEGEDPNDELARLRLSLDYMKQNKFLQAQAILEDLTDGSTRQKANAFAGLALLAHYRGDYRDSQNVILGELKPLAEAVLPELQGPLRRAFVENQNQLGEKSNLDLDALFPPPDDDAIDVRFN